MKTLIILLCLICLSSQAQAADVVIRTKAGKTLAQAANEIKNYLNRHNITAAKYEDMLGDCMTPPIKSESGRWYVRIRIPNSFLDNVLNVLPNAINIELVGTGNGDFEIDPGVFVGKFA